MPTRKKPAARPVLADRPQPTNRVGQTEGVACDGPLNFVDESCLCADQVIASREITIANLLELRSSLEEQTRRVELRIDRLLAGMPAPPTGAIVSSGPSGGGRLR